MHKSHQALLNADQIEIPYPLAAKILEHAQSSPDREVCGLLGARNNIPITCYPVKNVSTTPKRRFLMDAKGQIEAMKAMRSHQQDLFAVYHSHPTAEAKPSKIDLEEWAYFEALYLIISLQFEGKPELRGFYFSHPDGFKEIVVSLQSLSIG